VNDALRRSAAHLLVDDLHAPVASDADLHHLLVVLRLRDGEHVTVTDGRGGWRVCRASGSSLHPITDIGVEPAPDPITVAVAIPKHDRPEWIVQKLTELGVDRIVLLHAARSVVRWDGGRVERHLQRLGKVAVEAAMQSRRVWLPELTGPVAASAVLPAMPVAEPGAPPPPASTRAMAIGPEGGWTPEELEVAAGRVGLGHNVLRVETAAVAAAVRMLAGRDVPAVPGW
jgi:16S rRNA (uracil1498-N3)-methyltransferase